VAGSGKKARAGATARGTLPELHRVLVPTDFSELSLAAVPFAYALVARAGCVHLLHVVEVSGQPNPLYAHYRPGRTPTSEERAAQEAALRERLAALAPAAARAKRVSTEIELVESTTVAECIEETARRRRVDAICMASHGRSGVGRALFGSVAEAVLRGSGRPVLIVPAPRS
jgi:nucleotide-binding universal stress UspA family protein